MSKEMKLYKVSGLAYDASESTSCILSNIYSSLEEAREEFSQYVQWAQYLAEGLDELPAAIGEGHATWTEYHEIHHSEYTLERYKLEVSTDLTNPDALAFFKAHSFVHSFETGLTSILNGIEISHTHSCLPFLITDITLRAIKIKIENE